MRNVGGDNFVVNLVHSDGTITPLPIVDQNNGDYFISFTPSSAGYYRIDVRLQTTTNPASIAGSPFELYVVDKKDSLLMQREAELEEVNERYKQLYHKYDFLKASVGLSSSRNKLNTDEAFVFKYNDKDEDLVIKALILDVDQTKFSLPPLAGQAIYSCMLYNHVRKHQAGLRSFFKKVLESITVVTSKEDADLDLLMFWLSNASHLFMTLGKTDDILKDLSTGELKFLAVLIARLYRSVCTLFLHSFLPSVLPSSASGSGQYSGYPSSSGGRQQLFSTFGRKSLAHKTATNADLPTNHLDELTAAANRFCLDRSILRQLIGQTYCTANAYLVNILQSRAATVNVASTISDCLAMLSGWTSARGIPDAARYLNAARSAAALFQLPLKTLEAKEDITGRICAASAGLTAVQVARLLKNLPEKSRPSRATLDRVQERLEQAAQTQILSDDNASLVDRTLIVTTDADSNRRKEANERARTAESVYPEMKNGAIASGQWRHESRHPDGSRIPMFEAARAAATAACGQSTARVAIDAEGLFDTSFQLQFVIPDPSMERVVLPASFNLLHARRVDTNSLNEADSILEQGSGH